MAGKNGTKVATCLIGLLVICCCQVAQAKPGYGVSCGKSGCHTTGRNAMTVVDHDTTTDLGQGSVKTFTVTAGQTISLSTNVTNGADKYAVALVDFDNGGVQDPSNTLDFTADSSWSDRTGSNPPYYVSSSSGHNWSGSTTKRTFQIAVDSATPADYYALEFEVAGKGGGKWAERETFYLHVEAAAPEPGDGDINGDGIVDFFDFSLLAMQWLGSGCEAGNDFCDGADVNVDGSVDIDDLKISAMNWLLRKPLAIRVAGGNDDAEENVSTSAVSLTSSDLELTMDSAEQLVGMRFNGINIEAGTVVADAYIQFAVDEASSGGASLVITGQAAGDAAAFSNTSGNISGRTETASFVEWSPADWNTVGDVGPVQQTPNLAVIIEEIINQPTWQAGNSIVLIVSGSGKRVAEAYDGSPGTAPILHIEFQ